MIRASIDIGTNTFLLLVAEVEGDQVVKVLRDEARVVRLGQGVDATGLFHFEAMKRAYRCLEEYHRFLSAFPGVECRVVATSASRDVKNSADFFKEIKQRYGFLVDVVSGEVEAQLSYLGSLSGIKNPDEYLVIDIGGGSTEIVTMKNNVLIRKSFDVGCVRLTERFIENNPAQKNELTQIRDYIKQLFHDSSHFFSLCQGKSCMSVAGTATYLAAMAAKLSTFDPKIIDGYRLDHNKLEELIKELAPMTNEQRLGLGGMDKGRADVIVSGAIILDEVLHSLGALSSEVSIRGLRYGIVLEN